MSSVVHSINISAGGVPKLPVVEARITVMGLEGDRQKNRRYHGGPNRAVCLYSLDRIEALRLEGHPIAPGTVGENVTVRGIDWSAMVPGVVVTAGGAELRLTSFTQPCKSIRKSFRNGDVNRIDQDRFPGWSRVYAEVLREGIIRVGDPVRISAVRNELTSALDLSGL